MDNLVKELKQAEQNFDFADKFHVDEAIKQMNEVRKKFDEILQEKKRGEKNE